MYGTPVSAAVSIAFSNTVRAERSDRPTPYDTNKCPVTACAPTRLCYILREVWRRRREALSPSRQHHCFTASPRNRLFPAASTMTYGRDASLWNGDGDGDAAEAVRNGTSDSCARTRFRSATARSTCFHPEDPLCTVIVRTLQPHVAIETYTLSMSTRQISKAAGHICCSHHLQS